MPAAEALGARFGRLVLVAVESSRRWHLRCDCGSELVRTASDVRRGFILSCGCLRRERAKEMGRKNVHLAQAAQTKHGHARRSGAHPLFSTWTGMIQRCRDPRAHNFSKYGGRGISVCARWATDFAAFLADVGDRPTARHTLDRINNDGNYEPGNVRWATPVEQARNRRPRRKS